MPKCVLPLLAVCLLLAGCTVFKRSRTWDTVTRTRPNVSSEPDPSDAYAQHLHRTLAARRVPHRVVHYEFRFTTRFREEAVGARTAVLYRDDTHPTHPWWITDERQSRPVWLPNGPVEKQLAFFVRGRAEVVRLRDFADDRGKRNAAPAFRTSSEEPRWTEIFRARHGTAYDPASALDRRKMSALQRDSY